MWQAFSQDPATPSQANPVAAYKLGCIETFCCLIWGTQAWKTQVEAAQRRGPPDLYKADQGKTAQEKKAIFVSKAFALSDGIEMEKFDMELAETLRGRHDPFGDKKQEH